MDTPTPRAVALLLAMAAFGVQDARAQERPEEARTARDTAASDTAASDTTPAPTIRLPPPPLGYDPAVFSLTVTLGRPGDGDAQTQSVRALRRDRTGAVLDSAVLSRTVFVRGTVYGGVSGTLSLSRRWGLRVGLDVAAATLQPGYSGSHEVLLATAEAVAADPGELRVVTVESTLRHRIASSKRMQPYIELGAAMSRWSVDGPVPEAALVAGQTRFEVVAGVGGVVPLTDRLSARLHASTRALRTPILPLAAGDTVAASTTLLLTARPSSGSVFADDVREVLGLTRLDVGLSLDLGRVAARPGDRPEPSAPSPPPGP